MSNESMNLQEELMRIGQDSIEPDKIDRVIQKDTGSTISERGNLSKTTAEGKDYIDGYELLIFNECGHSTTKDLSAYIYTADGKTVCSEKCAAIRRCVICGPDSQPLPDSMRKKIKKRTYCHKHAKEKRLQLITSFILNAFGIQTDFEFKEYSDEVMFANALNRPVRPAQTRKPVNIENAGLEKAMPPQNINLGEA